MICARVFLAGSLCCLTLWTVSVGVLWAAEPYIVFRATASRSDTSSFDPAIFHRGVFFNREGLMLSDVTLKHAGPRDRYWILFCPPAGASTQVVWVQDQLRQLWTLGYDVFAFDYRGFGESEGTPTEHGVYEDAAAAFDHLTRNEGVPASRVILAGRSLGSAIAVHLASRVDSAGVLLFSPIDSVPSVAARLYPWAPVRLLARHQFDSMTTAGKVSEPVLMFHGWPDSYMKPPHARALLAQFHGRKKLIETGGGHYFAGFVDTGELNRALKQFWPVSLNR